MNPKDMATLEAYKAELRRVMMRVLEAFIEDKNIQAMMPFQTTLKFGTTKTHIVNESFYDVQTQYHSIEKNDALCARHASFDDYAEYKITSVGNFSVNVDRYKVPTCPGCIAKAKRIIVWYLLDKCEGDHVRVAQMLADKQ